VALEVLAALGVPEVLVALGVLAARDGLVV